MMHDDDDDGACACCMLHDGACAWQWWLIDGDGGDGDDAWGLVIPLGSSVSHLSPSPDGIFWFHTWALPNPCA
jgi:hypothetical protein